MIDKYKSRNKMPREILPLKNKIMLRKTSPCALSNTEARGTVWINEIDSIVWVQVNNPLKPDWMRLGDLIEKNFIAAANTKDNGKYRYIALGSNDSLVYIGDNLDLAHLIISLECIRDFFYKLKMDKLGMRIEESGDYFY